MKWIKRTLILKLLVFFFISLLTVKLFDLALGLIDGSDVKEHLTSKRSLLLKEHAPNLDSIVKPSNDHMVGAENLKQKDFALRTDKDGFIVGPRDNDNAKDKVSIIFFGGSTTECIFVEEELRFPYLISQKLNVRILNSGVSGNHSLHSLLLLVGKGLPYKPNHVVLMHAVNDLGSLSKTLSYWDAPYGRSLVQTDAETPKRSALFKVASLVKNLLVPNLWLKTRHIFAGMALKIAPDEWAPYRDRKYEASDVETAVAEQFTAALKSFVALSRAWNIEPILMTQFNRIKKDDRFSRAAYDKNSQPISYDDFVRLYERTNEIVRAVAKQENVFLIDLDAQIPPSKEYIYDSVHLNTKGSELVAEKISAALKNRYPSVYR
jgi:lysophospholipase L1-like esterase